MWSQMYQKEWVKLPPLYRSEGGKALTPEQFEKIALTIVRLAEIQPTDAVIDLGCSIGALTYTISHHCRKIVGIDFLADSLQYAREHNSGSNIEYYQGDLGDYELDEDFDCIVINNVIHTLDSWEMTRELLQRCYSRLRPSGRLYLGEVPDTAKSWNYLTSGWKGIPRYLVQSMPAWSFPLIRGVTRRPMKKIFWYNRSRIARFVGCSENKIKVYDDPELLINPVERSHFVVFK